MRSAAFLTALSLVLAPWPVAAQQPRSVSDQPKLIIPSIALAHALERQQTAPRDEPDSLLNGTIIGAVIGGAVMGGFVTFLCNALQEPSDPSCLPSSLLAIGIGAGAGAAGGLAIDAMLDKQRRPVVRVRVPLGK